MMARIQDFVKKAIAEIETAIPEKYALDGSVDFELSLQITGSTAAGINIKVVDFGKERSKETTQTVSFSIRPKGDIDYQIEELLKSKFKSALNGLDFRPKKK